MVDLNKNLPLARMVVFGVVCVLGLVNFALACYLTSVFYRGGSSYYGYFGSLYHFAPLGLVTGLLTLLTLPLMYFLSISRKGAFTSYIVVEVVWCWFLWIMWVSTAGSAIWVNGASGTLAGAAQALEAFSFLNWFALMFYTFTLFVVAIMAHHKGNSGVWTSSVREFDFNTAVNQSAIPAVAPQGTGGPQMAQQPYYPPQQPMQQQPLAPQAGYAPQAAYTPQHTGGSGFAGQPHTPNQPPVAMV